ncbi:MAG: T9SS type A sorting domain-containing protein [Candidatus Eisenbacteria bacterium]|nr:T9SS type A sorting domain-containing protein [Candidatus Eisenbacteria bacterium]
MKTGLLGVLVLCIALGLAAPAAAQAPRQDVIWARTTDGAAITLDGRFNEPAWALAESVTIKFAIGFDNGIPGSGWKTEGGSLPTDKTNCTLKFLVAGNRLYMAATLRDSSLGGSRDFNRFDGLLMGLKDHSDPNRPAPVGEYFYSWWYPDTVAMPTIGPSTPPGFIGKWATWPPGTARTPTQVDAWDAVSVIKGVPNSDTGVDTSWSVEMMFNLTPMGYDVTKPAGDEVEWNLSIYDLDWFWPLNVFRMSANRTWWQSPWGNTAWYHEVKIQSRPSVTIHSGALPSVGPEYRVPNAQNLADPVMDGLLTESAWGAAPSFKIQYGNSDLRNGYQGVGPWRSGQYQPTVNGGQAAIADTGANAVVKYFFKADTLYLGFDVTDQVVQYVPDVDRWDGFIVTVNDRGRRGALDHNLLGLRLTFQVGPTGLALAQDSLPNLIARNGAKLALALKPLTTVDTTGATPDQGYTAELAIDLTKIGYPAGRGDGTLFLGVDWLNGESYGGDFISSYATRTWWFRQYENECCPTWGYFDPSILLVGVDQGGTAGSGRLALFGNSPNPFRRSTSIRYRLASAGQVTVEVFDIAGRRVSTRLLGVQKAGSYSVPFERAPEGAGVYMYRVRVTDPGTGALLSSASGKMTLLR